MGCENEKLRTEIQYLNSRIDKLSKENAKLISEKNSLQTENNELKNKIEQTPTNPNSIGEPQPQNYDNLIKQLNQEIAALKFQNAYFYNWIVALMQQLSMYQNFQNMRNFYYNSMQQYYQGNNNNFINNNLPKNNYPNTNLPNKNYPNTNLPNKNYPNNNLGNNKYMNNNIVNNNNMNNNNMINNIMNNNIMNNNIMNNNWISIIFQMEDGSKIPVSCPYETGMSNVFILFSMKLNDPYITIDNYKFLHNGNNINEYFNKNTPIKKVFNQTESPLITVIKNHN